MELVPTDSGWPTVRAAEVLAAPFDETADAASELDRQVAAYVSLGLADALGLHADDVASAASQVRPHLPEGGVPAFLLVLAAQDADVNALVPAMRVVGRRSSRSGVSVVDAAEAAGYRPLPDATPPAPPYLLLDVDPGTDLRSTAPRDALAAVRGRGRTPLTLHEGVLLAAIRPDLLRPNECWSLAGSRAANQRVPAVWISDRRPKLGWCWDGNPHTWLGLASASGRVAVEHRRPGG